MPPDTTWYLSSRPFIFADFGRALDDFSVTTGGTIASTPASSGSSGFSGGGFSGGGGGGRRRRVLVTRSMGRRAHRLL